MAIISNVVIPRTNEISKLSGKKNIGICGATSTPKWLMEEVAEFVKSIIE